MDNQETRDDSPPAYADALVLLASTSNPNPSVPPQEPQQFPPPAAPRYLLRAGQQTICPVQGAPLFPQHAVHQQQATQAVDVHNIHMVCSVTWP